MSKKQSKKKQVKKAVKKSKSKSVSKPARLSGGKSKQAKTVKKAKTKVVSKPSRKITKPAKSKVAAKKAGVKKVVARKTAPASKRPVKKIRKPIKTAKKAVKAAKPKVSSKKIAKPVKKVAKPLKKAAVKKIVSKPIAKKADKKLSKPIVLTNNNVKAEKNKEKMKLVAPQKAEKLEKIKSIKDKPLRPKGKGGRKPKSKDGDDDEPEIVHDELIEQIIRSTKRQRKEPKVPKMLKTFVNPMETLSTAQIDHQKKGVAKKEPKGKFELEYVVRTSAGILYEFLTTPSGLSEWFADDVNIRDGVFTFFWDGSEQKAKLLGFKEDKYLRLQWLDKSEGSYFEFRIERDELTGDISLMVVDFADESSDMQTSKLLWDSQINKLLHVLGSN